MKLFDVRNTFEKEELIEKYEIETDTVIENEEITKRELIRDILDYRLNQKQRNELYEYFDMDEVYVLKEMFKHPIQLGEYYYTSLIELESKLFIYRNDLNEFDIYEEFRKPLTNLFMDKKDEMKTIYQFVVVYIKKLLATYYSLPLSKLVSMVQKQFPDLVELKDIQNLLDTINMRYYCHKSEENYWSEEIYIERNLNNNYAEVIASHRHLLGDGHEIHELNNDIYDGMYHGGIVLNKKVTTFLYEVSKYFYDDETFQEFYANYIVETLFANIVNEVASDIYDLDLNPYKTIHLLKLYLASVENTISPMLGGLTLKEFKKKQDIIAKQLVDQSDWGKDKVYTLYTRTLFYCYEKVNELKKIFVLTELADYMYIPATAAKAMDTIFYKNRMQYASLLADLSGNKEIENTMRAFKNVVYEVFIFARYEQGYSYLIDNKNKVYKVRGRTVSLKEMGMKEGDQIRFVIYPFKGIFMHNEWVEKAQEKKIGNKPKKVIDKLLADKKNYVKC